MRFKFGFDISSISSLATTLQLPFASCCCQSLPTAMLKCVTWRPSFTLQLNSFPFIVVGTTNIKLHDDHYALNITGYIINPVLNNVSTKLP